MRMHIESQECDLSSALDSIRGELLVLKGTKEGSLLNEEQLNLYEKYNPTIIRVQNAGHDVFEPRHQVKEAILNYFNDII
ncbi:hypothetical protein [Paenibacillus segetis]|uniref:Uncharacterized protein n=1 Tax=Paenibacillus segetis TaxID=1325360 RepID=A0ABQ1YEJ0_9BACL|nr:hypothetical protein [Paenibacillus segetis]GGH23278.1 hypothetical protein GCM10008013_22270 [Paenibacillus segetis]